MNAIGYKRHGGIRFVRLYNLNVTFSIRNPELHMRQPVSRAMRLYVASGYALCAIALYACGTYALALIS